MYTYKVRKSFRLLSFCNYFGSVSARDTGQTKAEDKPCGTRHKMLLTARLFEEKCVIILAYVRVDFFCVAVYNVLVCALARLAQHYAQNYALIV